MGKRQISQLNFFDYINGITIGSIAAEMAIRDFEGAGKAAVAMGVYALVATVISYISDKSIKARTYLCGTPTIILNKGKIYRSAMKKARIDINELLMQARISGYYDLNQVQTVILEANGTLSFLPKSDNRPVTPSDIDLTPTRETMYSPLIIDGKVIEKNLIIINKSLNWLHEQIKKQNVSDEKDILLAMFDGSNFVIYRNEE
ncbi:MAG: DUF421 domain-containing protein [Clostridia bacterium]|nr:DUF421 domain-containing protein [Clostridia bacterium]